MSRSKETFYFDIVVVGGGVIGAAVAARLSNKYKVLLAERNRILGAETSSRNSEVIHAGIYYKKNSFKAIHCVEGRKLLYEYLENKGIRYKKTGKIIVGSKCDESTLSKIYDNAKRNGVHQIKWVSKNCIFKLEPELSVDVGLFSSETGIFDSHGFIKSLEAEIIDNEGIVLPGASVVGIESNPPGYILHVKEIQNEYNIQCSKLIIAAGHETLSLVNNLECVRFPFVLEQKFAKGIYANLIGKTNFRHLIYPAPEKGGLGIHLTLDLQGNARFGPNVVWTKTYDTSTDDFDPHQFENSIAKYWPEIKNRTLSPSYAGSRPKITIDGDVSDDFMLADQEKHGASGLILMLGIESPGLTSALSIANWVDSKLT